MRHEYLSRAETMARAHCDELHQAAGWDSLALILGDPTLYFELEAARRPRFLHQVHGLCDFDAAALWELVDQGELDIQQNQFRMVKVDSGGFNCLPVEAYVGPDGRHADPRAVRRCHEQGATLIVQLLDRYHARFNRLCTGLSAALGHPCQISAYLTPPNARGLDIHHDWHDVLVLQVEGTKQFRTYAPVLERPLPQMHLSADAMRDAKPELSPNLSPGDALYLPRGVPHGADAGGNGSLHLSLGILSVTWASLLSELAGELYFVDALEQNCPARALYRPSVLNRHAQVAVESLCGWLQQHGAQRLAALAAQRFVQSFGARAPLSDFGRPPALSIDPGPNDSSLLIDPHRATAMDGESLAEWARRHPSDEAVQEQSHVH